MKRKWIAVLAIGIAMLVGTANANDGEHGKGKENEHPKHHSKPKPEAPGQCVQDATQEKKACKQVCQDTFLAAVDTCRNLPHDCVDLAREAHQTCVTGVLDELSQCIEKNCSIFNDLIQECRDSFPPGSDTRDKCIDGAQVQRFQCRDLCRENTGLFARIRECRTEFRADLKACRNSEPVPTPQ